MSEFEKVTDFFMAWLPEVGIKLSENVRIVDFRNCHQGRSMICTKDVKTGDELFRIPYSALLNIHTGSLSLENPRLVPRLRKEVGHWEGLLLTIFYELKHKKETSKWWPYLQLFPTEFDTLIYWNKAEIKTIYPSLVTDRIGKESSLKMYGQLLKHIDDFDLNEAFGTITYDEFMRIASTIMAYSFDRELDEENEDANEEKEEDESPYENTVAADMLLKSMVAVADILNSDTKMVNANIMYEQEFLVCRATENIKMNAQIFNIYGDHPNAEILRRYGYVEWDGSKYDFGEVRLQNILEAIKDEYKVEHSFLEKLVEMLRLDEKIIQIFEFEDVVLDSFDCYENGIVSVEAVVVTQVLSLILQLPNIAVLNDTELLKLLQRTVKKSQQLVESGRVTTSVSVIWETAVKKRLEEYPSFLFERDFSVTNGAHVEGISKRREMMAKCVLKCEVRCLQNCAKCINHQFKLIDDGKMLRNISKRSVDHGEISRNGKPKRQKL